MKNIISLVIIFLGLVTYTSTGQDSSQQFDSFWQQFQDAVAGSNINNVADLTYFPVRLVKYINDKPEEILLDRSDFIKMYKELFAARTKDMIIKTSAGELLKRPLDPKKAIKEGVPGASEVYYFNIPYDDRQKKRANIFYFLKGDGKVRIFILLAAPVKNDIEKVNPSGNMEHSTK